MAELNKLTIQIGGAKYPITTAEDPEYVRRLADEIDQTVSSLLSGGGRMSLNEALVLAALSYLDQYKKSEQGADHLRGQITQYAQDANRARVEAEEAKRRLERLSPPAETAGV